MTEEIFAIVASILQRDEIDPDDDLFRQGATSLAYVRIVAEINKRWRLALNGSEVGDVASVRTLAAAVAAQPTELSNA